MADGLDDLSTEEQTAIRDVIERVDVDRIAEATGVSRRQALQVIAATGVGIAVGGIGTNGLVGQAKADASTSDGDGNVGLPSNRVDVFADGIDSNSVKTDEADITNETLISAIADASNQSISQNTYTTVEWNTEQIDDRDELDLANNQWSVDSSGWYQVTSQVAFGNGGTSDRVGIRLYNSTDDITVKSVEQDGLDASGISAPVLTTIVNLDSAKTYEFQAIDRSSSVEIVNNTDPNQTFVGIRSVFR